MLKRSLNKVTDAVIELQELPHQQNVQEAIDLAYRNLFNPAESTPETITDLLEFLKKSKKLGDYQPDAHEQDILKVICRRGHVKRQVQNNFFDFIKPLNQQVENI